MPLPRSSQPSPTALQGAGSIGCASIFPPPGTVKELIYLDRCRTSPTSSRLTRRSTRSSPPTSRGSRGGRGRVPPGGHARSSTRARGRSSTCGSCARARWRSSTTAACSTCSDPASCSGTARCSPACRPASRRSPPRTRSATGSRAEVALPLLARPAGLRYVTRSLLESLRAAERRGADVNPAQRPVAELMRAPLVLCSPDTTIREAARS